MSSRRRRNSAVAVLVATAALGVASRLPGPPPAERAFLGGSLAPCGDIQGGDGQGQTGGTNNEICQGAGAIFIGPAVGQVATVVGPTIIGPTNAGAINVSAGNIAGNAGSASGPVV